MTIQDGLKNNPFLKRCVLFTSLLVCSSSVFAFGDCTTAACAAKVYKGQCNAGGYDCPPIRPHGIFAISGGYGYSHVGKSQTIHSADTAYIYDADDSVQSQPFGGFTIGGEFFFLGGYGIDVGLAYYQSAAFKAEGTFTTKIDDVVSTPSNYKYSIIGRQALIEFKFLTLDGSPYHPYITIGVGEAFNTSYSYDTYVAGTPMFKSALKHSFAFAGGAGLDVDVVKHIRLGAGYRYANFGDANTGFGHFDGIKNSQTDALEVSNLNTQGWIIQLTVIM